LQELLEHKPLQWETFNFCECWNSFEGEGAGACQPVDNHHWGCEWSVCLVCISEGSSDRSITVEIALFKVCSASADDERGCRTTIASECLKSRCRIPAS
jgi:hypothetical protein